MSADRLREAASLMRSRAEAATAWLPVEGWWDAEVLVEAFSAYADDDLNAVNGAQQDAEHLASWHPAVALAVAEWLDLAAELVEASPSFGRRAIRVKALAVANAYLGDPS